MGRDKFISTQIEIIMINNGWDKRKNVKTALRSFKIFRDKIPGAELHLFGEGYGPDGPAEEKSRILELSFLRKFCVCAPMTGLDGRG